MENLVKVKNAYGNAIGFFLIGYGADNYEITENSKSYILKRI